MAFLTQHLPFEGDIPALPLPGRHLLVTDTLQSPAKFVLYHLMAGTFAAKIKVVLVDFRGEGRPSHEAGLKKLNVTLPTSNQLFVHVAPSTLPSGIPTPVGTPRLFDDEDCPTLRPTFDALLPHTQGSFIVLDGLGELLRVGFSSVEINRFVRATMGRARVTGARVVSTMHADCLPLIPSSSSTPAASDELDLVERLWRLDGGWWRVAHLTSGRSGDVHGEISAHANEDSFPRIPRDQPLQYRLENTAVKVFPKGTGRGFL